MTKKEEQELKQWYHSTSLQFSERWVDLSEERKENLLDLKHKVETKHKS